MTCDVNIFYVGGSGGNFLVWNTLNALKYDTLENTGDSHNEYFDKESFPFIQAEHPDELVDKDLKLSSYEGKKNFVVSIDDIDTARIVKLILTSKKSRNESQKPEWNAIQNTARHFVVWSRILLTADRLNPTELSYRKMFLDYNQAYIKERYTYPIGLNEEQSDIFIKRLIEYSKRNIDTLRSHKNLKEAFDGLA